MSVRDSFAAAKQGISNAIGTSLNASKYIYRHMHGEAARDDDDYDDRKLPADKVLATPNTKR